MMLTNKIHPNESVCSPHFWCSHFEWQGRSAQDHPVALACVMSWYHTLHQGQALALCGLRKLPECPSSGDGRECDVALKAGSSIPQQKGGGERGRQAWVRLWGHCWRQKQGKCRKDKMQAEAVCNESLEFCGHFKVM